MPTARSHSFRLTYHCYCLTYCCVGAGPLSAAEYAAVVNNLPAASERGYSVRQIKFSEPFLIFVSGLGFDREPGQGLTQFHAGIEVPSGWRHQTHGTELLNLL
jgi:hypothetical protein